MYDCCLNPEAWESHNLSLGNPSTNPEAWDTAIPSLGNPSTNPEARNTAIPSLGILFPLIPSLSRGSGPSRASVPSYSSGPARDRGSGDCCVVGNMALSLLLVSRSRNRAAGGALRAAKRDLAVPPAATGSLVCAHAQCHSLPIAHLQYTVRYTLAFF